MSDSTAGSYDVVVIGGGPAGSTIAGLLAQLGHSVLVLERETFPRFHIGESLLPCGMPVLERLGVEVEGRFLVKHGAEFIDERTGDFAFYDFADALPGSPPCALQVTRSVFDAALLERAGQLGAEIRYPEQVLDCEMRDDGVVIHSDRGDYRARFLVDATGRDAFMCRRERSFEPLHEFGKAAVFCHVRGLSEEVVEELHAQGNIKVLMQEEGWVWLIPLHGGVLSVGLVSRKAPITVARLDELFATSPLIKRLCQGGERTEAQIIGNFSYKNGRTYGPRFVCVGDAACFLDPVFSSGVCLALNNSERAANVLDLALREGDEARADLMVPVAAGMQKAYDSVGTLIHRFYHSRIVHNLFFAKEPDLELRAGLISLLAGDLWRDGNRFQGMLSASRRHIPQ